jgi:hypothetical protein
MLSRFGWFTTGKRQPDAPNEMAALTGRIVYSPAEFASAKGYDAGRWIRQLSASYKPHHTS